MKPRESIVIVRILKASLIGLSSLAFAMASMTAQAQTVQDIVIENPGFENGFDGWREIDPSGEGIAISGIARTGNNSLKSTIRQGHRIRQVIQVQPNTNYEVTVYIRGHGRLRVRGASPTIRRTRNSGSVYLPARVQYNSGDSDVIILVLEGAGNTNDARFDDVTIECIDVNCNEPEEDPVVTESAEIDFGLDPDLEPWENFNLNVWAIDTPAPRPEDPCRAERTDEDEWDIFRASGSSPYFFTHTDGGMRFVSRVDGATTSSSCNSGFPRSELREMLRAGNTSISTTGVNGNNWALGYQPTGTDHGGRNGVLKATLRINQVSTTGEGLHPGRTIIGQIHADNDEPLRLYYRKLPDAEFGCIYAESEIRDGDDVTFNMIGDERCEDNGPDNGVALNELISYEIINEDEDIRVIIRRGDQDGEIIGQTTIDLEQLNSGYDRADEWMYFKAGVYTQNNTGEAGDGDIATFYRLSNTHDEN